VLTTIFVYVILVNSFTSKKSEQYIIGNNLFNPGIPLAMYGYGPKQISYP